MDSQPIARGTWLAFAAVASLLLAGCPGSSAPAVAPGAPTGLKLYGGATFDELTLTWTPPASPVTGYEVEMRIEDGPWQGAPRQVPGNAIGIRIGIDPAVPELVTLWAHVRAWNGSASSPFTDPVSFFRGLRPLAAASAAIEAVERVRLTWTQGSTASPGIRIDRSLYDDPTFSWGTPVTVATLPAGTTTWLDADSVLPGRAVRYQLVNVSTYKGAPVESAPVGAGPGVRPSVAPPANLQVLLVGGAPSLTWTNQSGVATSLRVERADGLVTGDLVAGPPVAFYPVATLPPTATSWTDAVPAGAYTYRVAALVNQLPGTSAPAQVVVPPAGLAVSVVAAPQGDYATRASDGSLWVAGNLPGGVRLWEPIATGWTGQSFTPPGSQVAPPGPVLDAQGRPHLLYLQAVPGGIPAPSDLVYAWYDGVAWQHEVIAQRIFAWDGNYQPLAFLAFGAGGEPHAAWQDWDRAFPEHAVRTAGVWTVERLTSTLYDPTLAYSVQGFGASPDGTLSMLIAAPSSLVLGTKPASGAWSDEVAPTTGSVGWLHGGRLLPFTGGATIAYRRYVPGDPVPYRLTALTKTGSAWGTPVEIAAIDTPGATGQPWTGVSIGTRSALLVPQGVPEGLWLYRWDATGGWGATRLRQSTQWEACWLGFTPAGKLWVLAPGGSPLTPEQAAADALRQYLSFTEP